jgi:hypothetical protein
VFVMARASRTFSAAPSKLKYVTLIFIESLVACGYPVAVFVSTTQHSALENGDVQLFGAKRSTVPL